MIDRADPARPLRSAFLRGWLAGLGYFGLGCWWVGEAFLVDAQTYGWMAPFAVVLLAGGLALFWGGAMVVHRALSPRGPIRALTFAGILCGFEWLRGHVLTGFPWNLPGETWAAGSAPSQTASLVGAYGLSFITVAIAAGFWVVREGRAGRVVAGGALACLIALYGFGAWRLAQPVTPDGPPLRLRIVQANVAQQMKYEDGRIAEILARHLTLTQAPAAQRPDLVIWSEAAIPDAIDSYLAPGTASRAAVAASLTPGETLLVGAYRIAGNPAAPIYYNSLVAIAAGVAGASDGLQPLGVYDKYRLVPFGEYLPLNGLLTAIGFKKLTHVADDGFTSGPPPTQLALPGGLIVQPLICYEGLFPGFTRDAARRSGKRARLIVNVSNDAWFGVTSGPLQHLNAAAYRSIEEGLPMARATPTGVSALIDAYGRIAPAARLGPGAAGDIDVETPPRSGQTGYVKLGDGPFLAFLVVCALIVGAKLRRGSDKSTRVEKKT